MLKPTVEEMVQALGLKVLADNSGLKQRLTSSDVHRPALEVAGFMDHYPAYRIQVIGQTEHEFFDTLAEKTQVDRAEDLISDQTPAILFSRDLVPQVAIATQAARAGVPILGSHLPTTRLISRLGRWLDNALAPRTTIHGVFVELYGVGVLITGDSGIGKSETALALINRGHRLVADDAVEIRRPSADVLVGRAPTVTANLMELRGVGIIDVSDLFGAAAIRPDKRVELSVHFQRWQEGAAYDRLGFEDHFINILEVKVPRLIIPVAPGRDLAMIIETAAMNYRAKAMGYNSREKLMTRLDAAMKKD
jgi:HPr kinase/phosphorylase